MQPQKTNGQSFLLRCFWPSSHLYIQITIMHLIVGWLVGLYLGTVSLTMNLSQFWKHMVAIWSYVLPPKLYEAITLFIPAFLVPDQVDVVLMFCQLQPSTPQSRLIPWWRLLKFKYTYLSVDFYTSPSKMAHSSQAPKGAMGYCKSRLFVLRNHIRMGTKKLSTLASLCVYS